MMGYLFPFKNLREYLALFSERPLCILLTSAFKYTLSCFLGYHKNTCLFGSWWEILKEGDFTLSALVQLPALCGTGAAVSCF